jgi:ABC-type Fe3+-siderophore transport system permease subunit
MSANLPSALADDTMAPSTGVRAERLSWLEVALTVLVTSAAVLLVSFLSVVTNL